jgi:tRNA(adenine34) deaminase
MKALEPTRDLATRSGPDEAVASPWARAMELALEEADAAARDGDVPVGAVLVPPSLELMGAPRGRNLREASQDPTAHAEIVALRGGAELVRRWRLDGWTCVVTLEPCPMCAGALVNARVARIVFGCRDPKAGAVRSLFEITSDPRLNHRLEVVEGVLAEPCAERLKRFFAERRREGKK